jgi:hypothetical protein
MSCGRGLLLPLLLWQLLFLLLGTSEVNMQHYQDLQIDHGSWEPEGTWDNGLLVPAHTLFFSLDYHHVRVPFEIILWMLTSLAMIGN